LRIASLASLSVVGQATFFSNEKALGEASSGLEGIVLRWLRGEEGWVEA
jgi:hypothetical protein